MLWQKERDKYYLKEIKRALKTKGQILVLVPEISKIEIFFEKFIKLTEKIEIYHKKLSGSKQLNIWQKIKENKIKIIIGTRSLLFLPFTNLSLIIVEEEESKNYKSWEKQPRYNARDLAVKLANLHKAKIILGTDTPSLYSFYLAKEHVYLLKKEKEQKKEVKIVDMKEERKWGNFSLFSNYLIDQIYSSLEKKEKILLFLGRRGFMTSAICKNCGHIIKCPNCDAPMVYHREKKKDILLCHHCGKKIEPPSVCPKCGKASIRYVGGGTQRVKQELENIAKKLWQKEIIIARIDSDVSIIKQEKIIKKFLENKIDIIVATNMIFNYPQVTFNLASILWADQILYKPEFNAAENLLHLLVALSKISKQLIVQTYKADYDLFTYFQRGEIEKFLEKEIKLRKEFLYPPFSKLIKIIVSQKSKKASQEKAYRIYKEIKKFLPKEQILGPAPSLIPKIKNQYIVNIVLKILNKDEKKLKKITKILPSDIKIDVDPVSIL